MSSYKILKDGGSSLDAVEFAVSEFEDSSLFNAYKGLLILQTKLKKWMLQLCSD